MERPIRVLALAPLPLGRAGTRHSVEQYVEPLRELGISVDISPFFDEAAYRILYRPGRTAEKALGVVRGMLRRVADLARARRYDLVYVYRESTAFGPLLFEWVLQRLGVGYVFNFDDALWLSGMPSVNKRWSWLRPPSRIAKNARDALAVVVSTEYIAQAAREWNDRVTVIMTPVDTWRHSPRAGSRPVGPPVIGWLGSQFTAPYLRILDDALGELARRREFVFRVVGGDYSHPTVVVEQREFDVDREADDIRSFDIGVLPEPDDEWVRGKGGYKGLLYMATGIPVVASHVGLNPEVVLEGETGFCVGTTAEWVEALQRLLDDPVLRTRLGQAGRDLVEERYSLRVQAPRLARVIRDAVQRSHARATL